MNKNMQCDIPTRLRYDHGIIVPFPNMNPARPAPPTFFKFKVPDEMLSKSENPELLKLTCPPDAKFKPDMNMGFSQKTMSVTADTIRRNITAYMEHGPGFTMAQTRAVKRDTHDLDAAAEEIQSTAQNETSQEQQY